jgi:hypothetical protein
MDSLLPKKSLEINYLFRKEKEGMQEAQKVRKRVRQAVVPKARRAKIIADVMTDFVEHAVEKSRESAKRTSENPFNLLPENVSSVRKLERTYSTSSGSVLIQRLAAYLAEAHMGYGRTNYPIVGRINTERMRRINAIMNSLESTGAKPNFEEELAYVLRGKSKSTVRHVVTADVYMVNRRGDHSKIAVECKSPLANSDQARSAKERILKLYAMDDPLVDEAYFVLNYNPYGGGRENYVWSPPTRWFNIKEGDPSILIGKEFWDKIGGNGTYALIEAVSEEVRAAYADEINKEFVLNNDNVAVSDPSGLYRKILELQEHFEVE